MRNSILIFSGDLFGALSSRIKIKSEVAIESKIFTEGKDCNEHLAKDLTEEIVDTLDIDKLRSIVKSKLIRSEDNNNGLNKNSNFLNLDKEKMDELENIIKLKQKEEQRNSKFQKDLKNEVKDLKNEVKFLRENANFNEIPNLKINKIPTTNLTLENMQISDIIHFKTCDNNQFSDPDILFSSKPIDNEISKKWFFDEKTIAIDFDKLTVKFEKFNDLNNEKNNLTQKKEFHLIIVEISNSSNSTVFFNNIQIDSTESQFFLKKNTILNTN